MVEKTGVASRLPHRFSHQNGPANRKIVLAAPIVQTTQPRPFGGKQEATVQMIPDAVF
jgi:hypothetical protein